MPIVPLFGHAELTDRLQGAARAGALPASLLLHGPAGVGKQRLALRLAQTLSGHAWTDYNLHDPGVTMLEQLCYALTDLVYRADFPVADHLRAPRSSGIRYAEMSLHPPQESAASFAEMEAGEQEHLKTFDRLIAERGVRPTLMAPVWRVAGFGLGAVTALMVGAPPVGNTSDVMVFSPPLMKTSTEE